MQALKLNAGHGWLWIRAGWRLFRRQPIGFAAILFAFLFALLAASLVIGLAARAIAAIVPFISADLVAALGSAVVATLTPGLTAGFMEACRSAEAGVTVSPFMLVAPFRSGRERRNQLLILGVVQVVALMIIVLATNTIDAPGGGREAASGSAPVAAEPTPDAGKSGKADTPVPVRTEAGRDGAAIRHAATVSLFQALAYLPVALLLWYAPMLVAWHRLSALKALFFSAVAVWRNLAPFIMYGIGWVAIWTMLSFVLSLVVAMVGLGNLSALLAAPLGMLILTWMYCSFYPTYATVFVAAEEKLQREQ